jgi:[NiFe] hydrogenase assembly HybE family chaperone
MSRVIDELVATYRHIGDERVRTLPIYQDKLSVEAVGFRPWEGCLVGVLITPWFMNLLLVPRDGEPCSELTAGSGSEWKFPSGTYHFATSVVEGVGVHLSAVLFSDMKAFTDQDTARAVAQEVMQRIFQEACGGDGNGSDAGTAAQEVLRKPVTRRGLLRRLVAVDPSPG